MTLYQCDRCGCIIVGTGVMQTIAMVRCCEFPHEWDLCETCIEELRKFMKEKRDAKSAAQAA